MLGASFLLGGLKYHTQEYNRVSARFQAGLLFLATVALLVPSAVTEADSTGFTQKLSVGLAVLLIVAYALGMLFSLEDASRDVCQRGTRRGGRSTVADGPRAGHAGRCHVLVALVSEVFVESVQQAAEAFGMTPAFVGFVVVALVGGAAEMASAFSGARKNRLGPERRHRAGQRIADRAVRRAGAGAAQLRDRPDADGPAALAGAVVMMLIAALTAALVTNSGRSAWFVGVLVLMVYLIFAMTLYMLPPRVNAESPQHRCAMNVRLIQSATKTQPRNRFASRS